MVWVNAAKITVIQSVFRTGKRDLILFHCGLTNRTKGVFTNSTADDVPYKITDVVNRLVSNEKDDSMLMSVDGATYILPPNSKFFLSDVAYFCKHFIHETGMMPIQVYTVILIRVFLKHTL